MSGWHQIDKRVIKTSFGMPMANNITAPGCEISDQVPKSFGSRNLTQAHFLSLKCYRDFCRLVPYIIHSYALRAHVTEQQAMLHLARHWRMNNKMRNTTDIDEVIARTYEKILNIKQQDIWGGYVTYMLCPKGHKHYMNTTGYSYYEEAKYGKKSNFLENFYTGGRKNIF